MLGWLSEVKCEDHHQEVVKVRLEGTGTWVLQRQEIRDWLESEESSVLWLHGKGNIRSASASLFLEEGLTFAPSWIGKDNSQVGMPPQLRF